MEFSTVKLSQLEEGGAHDARGGAPRPKSSLAPLIASIKEHDLLQPLVVRRKPGEEGRFKIVAGNRRFAALRHIHGKKDVEIPVMIASDAESDRDAFELSLAENVVREQMHPVDEHDAYTRLVNEGWAAEQIAKRFGVKEKWIKQRLQLSALAPELRDEWRVGKLSADQAEALSSQPDHAAQVKVWKDACKNKHYDGGRKPEALRRELARAAEGVSAGEPLAKFVGLDAYRAAGGRVREDLFTDESTLLDVAILKQVADEKLQVTVNELLAQGWAWAIPADKLTIPHWQIETLDVEEFATDEERPKLKGKVQEAWKIEEAIKARMENDPIARAKSGVIVEIGNDGEIELETLQIMPAAKPSSNGDVGADEDDAPEDDETHSDDDEPGDEGGAPASPKPADSVDHVNYALRETVSELLTRALSRAVAVDAQVAVAALGATLSVSLGRFGASDPLRVSASEAWPALTGERTYANGDEWSPAFQRLVALPQDRLMREIGVMAAKCLDVRFQRNERGTGLRRFPGPVDALAAELSTRSLNDAIAEVFNPDDYFGQLTKDEINTALTEMLVEGKRPVKKDALVKLAALKAREKGWLPVGLRLPGLPALTVKEKAAA